MQLPRSHLPPGTTPDRTQAQFQHRRFIASGLTVRIPAQDGRAEAARRAPAAVTVTAAVAADLAATVAAEVVEDTAVAEARATAEAAGIAAEALPRRVVEVVPAQAEAEAEEVTEW